MIILKTIQNNDTNYTVVLYSHCRLDKVTHGLVDGFPVVQTAVSPKLANVTYVVSFVALTNVFIHDTDII